MSTFSRATEIKERLPKVAHVMAGDFGEILTFYLATQLWHTDATLCPMKWRFKDKKDAPSPYTDIIVFRADPNGACVDDTMFSFEVKVKSTAPVGNYTDKSGYKAGKQQCIFVDAVMDADKDKVSRAAECINYLMTRCKDLGLKSEYAQISRFAKPYGVTTTYKKLFTAVAVVDSSYIINQIDRLPQDLMATYPDIRVFVLPIKDLKALYESVYDQLPNA